ncbi:MAG: HEAT repeat domain-containing protein [Elusimicrobia bacterium]|nr:HEAT repeat domain-containing protein [Elusimicrobiota bacterium]
MSWPSFLRRGPQEDLNVLWRLWQRDAPRRELEEGLESYRKHGRQGLELVVEWAAQEGDDKAAFAIAALRELQHPDLQRLWERWLRDENVADERKVLLAAEAMILGLPIDPAALFSNLRDPRSVAPILLKRMVALAHDPESRAVFLSQFRSTPRDLRAETLRNLLEFRDDPRSVRLWAPLLYVHEKQFASEFAELARSTVSPRLRWWLSELEASKGYSVVGRRLGVEPLTAAAGAPGVAGLAPGRFYKAYLSAPDAKACRCLIFSQRLASGDIMSIRLALRGSLSLEDASGGTWSLERFAAGVDERRRESEGLMTEVSRGLAAQLMRDAERREFRRGGAFPETYLANKEAFFCEGDSEPARAEAEMRFDAFWGSAPPATAPYGAEVPPPLSVWTRPLPSAEQVERLLRCPCAGAWDLYDPDLEGPLRHTMRKAQKKARRSGESAPTAPAEFIPEFLPRAALEAWRQRLKDYSLIAFLQGKEELAAIARDCALSLTPELQARHPLLRALCIKTSLLAAHQQGPQRAGLTSEPLSKLFSWVQGHARLGAELVRFLCEKMGDPKTKVIVLESEDDPRYAFVTEWFIFDRPCKSYPGKTPLEVFVEQAALDAALRRLFELWRDRRRFGIFKVLERRIGQGVVVEDIQTKKRYDVSERLGSMQLVPGTALMTRVLPLGERHIFSGSATFLVETARYAAERLLQHMRAPLRPEDAFIWVAGAKSGDEEASGAEGDDLDALERRLAEMLKGWGARWLSVSAVKERLAALQDFGEGMAELLADIMVDCDQPPDGGIAPVEPLVRVLQAMIYHLPKASLQGKTPRQALAEHPRGPRETIIFEMLMAEVGRADIDPEEDPDYAKRWFATPQKELEGRTPEQVILEERRSLGNPEREVALTLQKTQMSDFQTPDIRYRRALRLQKEGYYPRAIEIYKTLRRTSNTHQHKLHGNLGMCCLYIGDKRRAQRELEKALGLDRKYAFAKHNLARLDDYSQAGWIRWGKLMGGFNRRKALAKARLSPVEKSQRLAELIDSRGFGWPVAEMEELLVAGPAAYDAVAARLAEKSPNMLPLLVLMGELRQAKALVPLGEVCRAESLPLAAVACDAMVRIGPESFSHFSGMLKAMHDAARRYLLYGALGRCGHSQAYPFLIDALSAEPDIKDAVAYALADLGNPEAIPEIYAAYKDWRPAHRHALQELEEAIGMLAYPNKTDEQDKDWRLRYRPRPGLGNIPVPGRDLVAAILVRQARDNPAWLAKMGKHPALLPPGVKRELSAILEAQNADRRREEADEKPARCSCCDEVEKDFWGLPTCSRRLAEKRRLIASFIELYAKRGAELVADAMDLVDFEQCNALEAGENPTPDDEDLESELDETTAMSVERRLAGHVMARFMAKGVRSLEEAAKLLGAPPAP